MRFFARDFAAIAATVLTCALCSAPAVAADPASAIAPCLECHDYGDDAPAHQVLLGSHGIDGEPQDMAGRRGCLDCHGESVAHQEDPRRSAPDLSFGPRWTADGGAQDKPCLTCHEEDTARHWQHALHMVNNMTCITCHDIHTGTDRVLVADEQHQVCTTCHKAQKSGIHDLGDKGPANPACSLCHNPHNHEAAGPQMAANQSAGCTFCHSGEQMEALAALNTRAGNYHRVLEGGKRGCLDCHQGISHAAEDSAPLLHPAPVRGRQVTLFYPGNTTRQWLVSQHPGSQLLRQGTDCARCHRGDEADMGSSLGGDLEQPWRDIGVAFSHIDETLHITLTWSGRESDAQLALMWGDDDNTQFRRGGCFAACHDNDQGRASRILYHGDTADSEAGMGGLYQGADLWRIELSSGELLASRVGGTIDSRPQEGITAQTQWENGTWSVQLMVDSASDGSGFRVDQRHTFGIALHGSENPGRQHWVSLPLTFSLSGKSSDFIAD